MDDSDESFWLNTASNLPWTCVYDESTIYSSYLKSYNVQQLPSVFLIDRDGNITDRPESTDEGTSVNFATTLWRPP